jgi:hypothetical protein
MARGDGIAKKGLTVGKNLGDDGPKAKTMKANKSLGVSNEERKADGMNRAKLAYQFGSTNLKGKGF